MTTTPCADPANSPDDWFIGRDGKQYPDDPELTDEELKRALQRRRHAKDKCFIECPLRLPCLTQSLEWRPEFGTWGGYYEEERRTILKELDSRDG